jgi:hypothetical protein
MEFKKNSKKTSEHLFEDSEAREARIAALFREASAARSETEEYWQKMRAYYSGTHETAIRTGAFLASVNLPWKPAQIADGYMHTEGQIVAKNQLYQEKYGRIVRRLMADVIELSSTEIRDRVKSGEGISDLVPAPVADYIKSNGLYR